MKDNPEFHGDIGQVVMGDVKNAAPTTQHNYHVVINNGKEFKPLTAMQRKAISKKADAVAKAKGLEKYPHIYPLILCQFGVKKMDDFPREKYQEAIAFLDRVLHETARGAGKDKDDLHLPVCLECEAKASACRKLQRQTRLLSVSLTIMMGVCGWVFFMKPPQAAASKEAGVRAVPAAYVASSSGHCYMDGREYSIGSMAKMQNGQLFTCTMHRNENQPRWMARGAEYKPEVKTLRVTSGNQ